MLHNIEKFKLKKQLDMQVYRYNEKLKRVLGSKTKPEPWLHVALIKRTFSDVHSHEYCYDYAIYVWDTRKVIEEGETKPTAQYLPLKTISTIVADNHKQLTGGSHFSSMINSEFKANKSIRLQQKQKL